MEQRNGTIEEVGHGMDSGKLTDDETGNTGIEFINPVRIQIVKTDRVTYRNITITPPNGPQRVVNIIITKRQ